MLGCSTLLSSARPGPGTRRRTSERGSVVVRPDQPNHRGGRFPSAWRCDVRDGWTGALRTGSSVHAPGPSVDVVSWMPSASTCAWGAVRSSRPWWSPPASQPKSAGLAPVRWGRIQLVPNTVSACRGRWEGPRCAGAVRLVVSCPGCWCRRGKPSLVSVVRVIGGVLLVSLLASLVLVAVIIGGPMASAVRPVVVVAGGDDLEVQVGVASFDAVPWRRRARAPCRRDRRSCCRSCPGRS